MKFAILLGLLGMTSAQASTLCLNFSIDSGRAHQPVNSARCEVDQNMDPTQLSNAWKCSFNGAAPQSVANRATWLSDANEFGPSTLFYEVDPNSNPDLGNFLFSGLKMSNIKMVTGEVEIQLEGDTPTAKYNDLDIIDNDWNFSSLHIGDSTIGSCNF